MSDREYENLNEAPYKLPRNRLEIFKDGWSQYTWRLVSGDWEIVKSKKKYKTLGECVSEVDRFRELMKDPGFCPTVNMEEVK